MAVRAWGDNQAHWARTAKLTSNSAKYNRLCKFKLKLFHGDMCCTFEAQTLQKEVTACHAWPCSIANTSARGGSIGCNEAQRK
eukprot:427323-Amphidinium_carterae.1